MLRKFLVAGAVAFGLSAAALSLYAPAPHAVPINDIAMTSLTASPALEAHAPGGEDISSVVTHLGTEVLSKNICTKPSTTSSNRIQVMSKVFTPRTTGDAAR